MRLLGEDSPVSKLQVKLEPGTLYSRLTLGTHAWHPQAFLSCCSLALLGLLYFTMPEFLPRPACMPIAPRENLRCLHLPQSYRVQELVSMEQSKLHLCTQDCGPPPCPILSSRLLSKPQHAGHKCQVASQTRCFPAGVNPSHLMNLFTYEKGYCFVYYLSQLCGDPQRFDDFLRVRI